MPLKSRTYQLIYKLLAAAKKEDPKGDQSTVVREGVSKIAG